MAGDQLGWEQNNSSRAVPGTSGARPVTGIENDDLTVARAGTTAGSVEDRSVVEQTSVWLLL